MNDQIQQYRDVAMGVLQPTQAELEHGLGLHANSVVIDAYAFAPRTWFDPAPLVAALEAGASDVEFQDLAEDLWMTGVVGGPERRADYVSAWDAAGVTCIFENAGEECSRVGRVTKRLARFTYVTDVLRGQVARAVTPSDVRAAKDQGQHCLLMSANAVPLSQDWVSVEEELGYVRLFFQLGVRMMHLTYNRRNMLGDGCAEPADAGLSDLGRAAIKEMNRVGVIVDMAHAGWRTTLEAARASERPVVASHSGCCAVNEHIRCKPDEVIRAIVDSGGYIGICCIPAFLGHSGDLCALLDHVDHVVQRFGPDHVAIGTDRAFTADAAHRAGATLPDRGPKRPGFAWFWPADDPMFDPKWHNNPSAPSLEWTNWPMFTVGLAQRGHSDDVIRKILGGNVLRVARAALDSDLGQPLLP